MEHLGRHAATAPYRLSLAILAGALLTVLVANQAVARQDLFELILVENFNPDVGIPEAYLWDINEQGRACGTSTYESSCAGFAWERPTGEWLVGPTWPRGTNNLDKVDS